MAIFHWSVQIIKRSKGRSSVAAAAYRSGEKIHDETAQQTHSYTKKQVDEKFILAPENSPEWAKDRSRLWNEVEKKEIRNDAQVAREINIALPKELSKKEQTELLSNYVQDTFVSKGMVADCCIHRDNPDNPHAHVMLTMRPINENGFLDKKDTSWNKPKLADKWREQWSTYANEQLANANLDSTIDHRSFKKQGLDLEPTMHIGPKLNALNKQGKVINFIEENKKRKERNMRKKETKKVQESNNSKTTEKVQNKAENNPILSTTDLVKKQMQIQKENSQLTKEKQSIDSTFEYFNKILPKDLDKLNAKINSLQPNANTKKKFFQDKKAEAERIQKLNQATEEKKSLLRDKKKFEMNLPNLKKKDLELSKKLEVSNSKLETANKELQTQRQKDKEKSKAKNFNRSSERGR